MNKETIYIEPENDITDIIAKVKGSKQKIVALVPPKKSNVLRSTINMKLITKAAKEFDKTVVLITADPSLMKLAMNSKVLVSENLQSPPAIPTAEDIAAKGDKEEIAAEEFAKAPEPVDKVIDSADLDDEEEDEKGKKKSDKDDEESDKKKDKKDKKSTKIPSLDKYRKKIIVGVIVAILFAGFLVWALIFAPKAEVIVSISTSSNNFSENVSFTDKKEEENAKEGKFYLEEQKYSDESETEFTATGKKDIGEKAKGEVVISVNVTLNVNLSKTIPAGTKLSYNDLAFYTDKALVFSFNGDLSECDNNTTTYCKKSALVNVTAASPGENYNISSNISLNSDNVDINSAFSNSAFSGGTSNLITIVQQTDIDAAKSKLTFESEEEGKKKLYDKISDDDYIIEESYKQEIADPVSSIPVGEEVKEGTKPTLKAAATYTVYTIDSVRIEEFIKKKTNLPKDQKIYSIGKPFIDKFTGVGSSSKLKTTYSFGPEITEDSILEKVLGKKIGEVQTHLKSINGVSDVKVNTSFFWVRKVPDDPNKVTITIKEE